MNTQPINPMPNSNTSSPEELIDVAKQNRDLLITLVANQEILVAESKQKNKWRKIYMWLGILKYIILGGVIVLSFIQMQMLFQKFLGIFQGSLLGKASNTQNPLKDFNPADLGSLLDNPAFESITQFFQ